MTDPWDWFIYLHLPYIRTFKPHVGKYTSPMDPVGICKYPVCHYVRTQGYLDLWSFQVSQIFLGVFEFLYSCLIPKRPKSRIIPGSDTVDGSEIRRSPLGMVLNLVNNAMN